MRVGVFDIGTKAVRLLVGDTKLASKYDFSFNDFNNFGDRTFLGDHIDSDGNLRIKGLEKTINKINEFKIQTKKYNIEKFIGVGTAVFRNINNCDDVKDILHKQTGIEIKVLSKEEEAEYSHISAVISGEDYLRPGDVSLLIDQGGGSTEISFAIYDNTEKIQFKSVQSLNLGTVELKNKIFSYEGTFENVYQELIEESRKIVRSHKRYKTSGPMKAFGVGSGITNMTEKRGNKKQHGIELSPEKIQYIADKKLQEYSMLIWEVQPNIDPNYPEGKKRLISSLKETYDKNPDVLDHPLSILLARVSYKEILDYYKIVRIRVCGAGLRYGVFFSQLFKY
jgi:exopolyphosphatase/guanosine-5'-triphosphate,3'-diphosphate pyrophosphatase|tara:strand:- start:223 stop:1236 length:1014 start_codon:yes stop_codon:yes gene_type:complete